MEELLVGEPVVRWRGAADRRRQPDVGPRWPPRRASMSQGELRTAVGGIERHQDELAGLPLGQHLARPLRRWIAQPTQGNVALHAVDIDVGAVRGERHDRPGHRAADRVVGDEIEKGDRVVAACRPGSGAGSGVGCPPWAISR